MVVSALGVAIGVAATSTLLCALTVHGAVAPRGPTEAPVEAVAPAAAVPAAVPAAAAAAAFPSVRREELYLTATERGLFSRPAT